MEMLTYKQAAELLECSYQTVRLAVTDERLTQVSTKKGPRLIREQVELFKGKNGISDRVLSLEEKGKWNEYRDHAEKYTLLESTVSQKLVDILTRLEARESFSENKLAAMEKISNVMDECMRLIKSLSIETNINVPSEMSNSFPHLPLVQKKA